MGLGTVLARNCKITTVRRQNCLQQVMYDKTSIYFLNVSIDYSALYQYLTTEKVTPENKVKPREHFFLTHRNMDNRIRPLTIYLWYFNPSLYGLDEETK